MVVLLSFLLKFLLHLLTYFPVCDSPLLFVMTEIDPPETYVSENSDDLHHFHDE